MSHYFAHSIFNSCTCYRACCARSSSSDQLHLCTVCTVSLCNHPIRFGKRASSSMGTARSTQDELKELNDPKYTRKKYPWSEFTQRTTLSKHVIKAKTELMTVKKLMPSSCVSTVASSSAGTHMDISQSDFGKAQICSNRRPKSHHPLVHLQTRLPPFLPYYYY